MDIISFLTQGWILGITFSLIGAFLLYRFKKTRSSFEDTWLGVEYTRSLYAAAARRPILLLNNNKPLKVTNYKDIIGKQIRKNLIKRINNSIYKGMLIDNSQYVLIQLSLVEESMLPYEYQDSFNAIFKDIYVDLVKEYEKSGFDIESDLNRDKIVMKIWGNPK